MVLPQGAILNWKLALGKQSTWLLWLVPFPNAQRGSAALSTHPSAEEEKNGQPTQGSGFYYWHRVILKLLFKMFTVRSKMKISTPGVANLMVHRLHLACRNVLFGLHAILFFKFWIGCQHLKFGKYHTKCQISRLGGRMGSHSCLVPNKKVVNVSCPFRQSLSSRLSPTVHSSPQSCFAHSCC